MQVGTTKDLGLYNKPSAAVHPGTLAVGTLPQYNTIQYNAFLASGLVWRSTSECTFVLSVGNIPSHSLPFVQLFRTP